MNFQSLGNGEFPKVYKNGLFLKFVFSFSFLFLIFCLWDFVLVDFLSYYKNDKFIFFLVILVFLFFLYAIILSSVESIFIYEDKIVQKGVFTEKEIYFSEVKGYKKYLLKSRYFYESKICCIISKNGHEISISDELVGYEKLFKFIEENFEYLGKNKFNYFGIIKSL